MATQTNSQPTTGRPSRTRRPYWVSAVVDFATDVPGSTDVYEVINIPAQTLVIAAGIYVITADSAGNSGTIKLGDGTVDWVAAAAPTSASTNMTLADVALRLHKTANTIDVTCATGVVNAKIEVWALMQDVSNFRTDQVGTFA